MRRMVSPGVWKQRTIEVAISVLRLMRIMNAAGDVELRSPARECPECKGRTEVLVVPEGLCSECWSRNAIAGWKVMSLSEAPVRVNGARSQRRERRRRVEQRIKETLVR